MCFTLSQKENHPQSYNDIVRDHVEQEQVTGELSVVAPFLSMGRSDDFLHGPFSSVTALFCLS